MLVSKINFGFKLTISLLPWRRESPQKTMFLSESQGRLKCLAVGLVAASYFFSIKIRYGGLSTFSIHIW